MGSREKQLRLFVDSILSIEHVLSMMMTTMIIIIILAPISRRDPFEIRAANALIRFDGEKVWPRWKTSELITVCRGECGWLSREICSYTFTNTAILFIEHAPLSLSLCFLLLFVETKRNESLCISVLFFLPFFFLSNRTWDCFRWNVWVRAIREREWLDRMLVLFKCNCVGTIRDNGRNGNGLKKEKRGVEGTLE